MRVSVVIPVFNEEKYIKGCLDSLMKQEEKPDEIIIVDNNCTDSTIKVAKEYQVKIVKEKKQGTIYARNAGFNAAKYDIIARCDADTILPADWIKKIKENFENKKIDALCGTIIFYDYWFFKQTSLPVGLFIKSMKLILKHYILAGPNMLLTKKTWEKVKKEVCLDGKKVHEDIDLSIHIAKYGQIGFDPTLFVYASGRRIENNPLSFFIEYPWRLIKTLKTNH
jgi:glycosyltransferase involved in cell wall biosynthesis